jgi:predicted amidohydrolase YtcJ
MGSAEAWMEDPYGDDPAHLGTHYFSPEDLVAIVRTAESRGMALKFHVNGDAAIDATLTALETVAADSGLAQTHVLDHVVLTDADDAARMAILGVVASVQPSHFIAAQFGETARLLGDRFDSAYDFRGFLEGGVPLALGTDWPVWPAPDPLVVTWNAASLPAERAFTIGEAMTAYSAGSAAAIGRGEELGRLDLDYLADFIVVDGDIAATPLAEVPDRAIEQVWVGGRQVR